MLAHREHDQSKRGASMDDIISGVYIISNNLNGHKYIGSSINFQTRKKTHLIELKANKHHSQYLQRAWNKYGEQNFTFEVLEICKIEYLIEREQHYIDTINPEYNISRTAGSCLGCKHSEETKQKLSRIVTGIKRPPRTLEHRRKLSEANKGKPFTEERCQNISTGNKGKKKRPRTEEYCRNIAKAHIGIPLSEEHKKSISESHKGKVLTEEHRNNISKALMGNKRTLGHSLSEEHRQKISASLQKHYKDKRLNKGGD